MSSNIKSKRKYVLVRHNTILKSLTGSGGGSTAATTTATDSANNLVDNYISDSTPNIASDSDGVSSTGGSARRRKRTVATLAGGATPTPPPASPALGGPAASVESQANADYRVAVFGAGGVGKSSIILRFIKNTFSESYVPTIEDIYQQVITCNQKNVCTLHIIDTTGSHQFPAMQRLSILKGNAFVIVYSITSRQSLEELAPIILALKDVKGDQIIDVPIILVGNKCDEAQKREVAKETGAKLAERWGCGFIETSAKLNENITDLFQTLLSMEKRRILTLSVATEEPEKANNRRKCSIM